MTSVPLGPSPAASKAARVPVYASGSPSARPSAGVDVMTLLARQPSEIQVQCFSHLDAEALAVWSRVHPWPAKTPFSYALALACRERYVARCAPEQWRLARFSNSSACGFPLPNWPRSFGQQQDLQCEVREAWLSQADWQPDEPSHPPISLPAMALHMASLEVALVMAAPRNDAENFGVERHIAAPARRAESRAIRQAQAWRALHLLGLSGPEMQRSLRGRLVAASSAVYMGHESYATELFASTWARSLAGEFGHTRVAPRATTMRPGPMQGHLTLLAAMKRAALLLGSAELYRQVLTWGDVARLAPYCDAYETAQDIRVAIFAGHKDLVRAMMAARGDAHAPQDLSDTAAIAAQVVGDFAAGGVADEAYLTPMRASIAAVAAVAQRRSTGAGTPRHGGVGAGA